jgi:cytochrome c biogenesis protein
VSHDHLSLFAERNRMSEMAVYIVHASLLLIFFGGIVDALWGWRGFVNLNQGEQSNLIAMQNGTQKALPFAIRCDGAGQENYTDGTPKRWWSQLVVVHDGKDVERKEIVVNDPLVYKGVRFYQASYGSNGKVDKLVLTANSPGSREKREISLGLNETVALDPETTVQFVEFIPDYVVEDGHVYTRSTSVQNPAAHLIVASRKAGSRINVWLPAIEGFAENAKAPYQFEAEDLKLGYFTGLQVSHEPGQWAVWSGVVLMGIGLTFVFYLAHTRFWAVPVKDAKGKLWLWLGGTANRNRDAFEQRFKDLTEKIEAEVKALNEAEAKPRVVSIA